jgi:hypothetical protein
MPLGVSKHFYRILHPYISTIVVVVRIVYAYLSPIAPVRLELGHVCAMSIQSECGSCRWFSEVLELLTEVVLIIGGFLFLGQLHFWLFFYAS